VVARPNPFPQDVNDRPISCYDYVFLLSKSARYYCNFEVLPKPYRRDLWIVQPDRSPEPHFAVSPRRLVELCVMAGSRRSDIILDPFAGSGTTLEVCSRLGRRGIGLELNPAYIGIAQREVQTGRRRFVARSNSQQEKIYRRFTSTLVSTQCLGPGSRISMKGGLDELPKLR
jgi:site-specific DNA-methyltransferase (adenine-specific)